MKLGNRGKKDSRKEKGHTRVTLFFPLLPVAITVPEYRTYPSSCMASLALKCVLDCTHEQINSLKLCHTNYQQGRPLAYPRKRNLSQEWLGFFLRCCWLLFPLSSQQENRVSKWCLFAYRPNVWTPPT
jgi:hypothetical protein